jgi:hypothetical protein
LFASPLWFALEGYGETTRQIQMPFSDVVAVAAEQYSQHVSSVAFPVAWRLHLLDRGWKLTILLHTLQLEEATPCLIVLANDLLRRGGANERDILLVGLRVRVQLQVVAVLLAVEVVDLVLELRAVDC